MVTYAPFAILLGTVAAVALAFFAFWNSIHAAAESKVSSFATMFDRAGVNRTTEEIVTTWVAATAFIWIAADFLFRLDPLRAALMLPVAAALAGFGYLTLTRRRLRIRTNNFIEQLELALRLIASGLRSGLGMRQSLSLVIDEMPDPARFEFSRVIGQANIGVSMYDALDDLAARMAAGETLMMARVIRIQGRTGGDLAYNLEQLANTIKERRRMRRKIRSLTAEGRASAIVLVALPVFLGAFICLSQQQLGHALLFTRIGHITFVIVSILLLGGIFTLQRILRVAK